LLEIEVPDGKARESGGVPSGGDHGRNRETSTILIYRPQMSDLPQHLPCNYMERGYNSPVFKKKLQ